MADPLGDGRRARDRVGDAGRHHGRGVRARGAAVGMGEAAEALWREVELSDELMGGVELEGGRMGWDGRIDGRWMKDGLRW